MLRFIYTKLNTLFRLSFDDPILEANYQHKYFLAMIRQNRLATMFALIVNVLYLPVVFIMTPNDFIVSVKIIFFVIVPYGLLFIGMSHKPYVQKNLLPYLFSTLVIVSSGAVIALYFTQGNHELIYIVLVLPIIGIFLMSGAPFILSLLSMLLLILAYLGSIVFNKLALEDALFEIFIIMSTFLFAAISGYLIEKNHRKSFLAINSQLQLISQLKEQEDINEFQEQIMRQQSRLAQLGEMISMIAHQWRQPLSAISMITTNILFQSKLNDIKLDKNPELEKYEDYVNQQIIKVEDLVQKLSITIDDFRNFYKPNKQSKLITLDEIVLSSLDIIKSSLVANNITIIEAFNSQTKLDLYDNELMQVVLSLLSNAQDNFLEKSIQNPTIKIKTTNTSIFICDNGGGIDKDIIHKIFDPYFSTKHQKNGTGLGLYMSKIIIEKHHNGMLTVKNTQDGVCFIINLNETLVLDA